ncbi:lysoplasmalogenase [Chitinophaga solisilvae]|uniref:Lysoplasmalogenase n=1 Tax=Chitinophaga solisilvae TaxID=1233460 RepID=A0A3S1D324_9BACT|nr:lysoplasmalogenase [Chitinophaga solisilvae]NSL89657.1 lysoplasmalogenase [Chitinophaga solisilvae]
MLKSRWLLLFFVTLLADISLIAMHMDSYRYATKPLLMVILAVYFFQNSSLVPRSQRIMMYAALFFSFSGDVLLLSDHLFLPGLGSFLLAHLCYIGYLLRIRYSNPPVPLCKYPVIFLNAAAVIAFILFLLPTLGNMTIPVIVYALAISIMLQSALHAFHLRSQPAGWYCVLGALLFVISDSLIATGKFHGPIPGGDILVMLTYGLAQAGLVYGGARHYRDFLM